MKRRPKSIFVLVLVPLATALLPNAAFATSCEHADPTLAGHYFMRGVMEVGSELRLQTNGQFDYMLAYGALDELATGCWLSNGASVTLVVSKFNANMPDDPMKFDRLELEIKPGGKLVRRFDGGQIGVYSR